MKTELMKISNIRFGFGGYQGVQFGLSIQFAGKGSGVGTFYGPWAEWHEGCKWDERWQENEFAKVMIRLRDTLKDAKKKDISELVGTPVEVTFENNTLKDWRVLTEVL